MMIPIRAAALRTAPSTIFARSSRTSLRKTISQPCLRLQTPRRGYASATDTIKKTSDLPWAVTAATVTAVGTYIALSPSEDAGHGDHGDHHGKEDHGEDEAAESDESSEDKADEKDEKPEDDSKDEGKSEEGGKDDSEDEQNDSDDEGKDDARKGMIKDKSDNKKVEAEPGKKANKIRIDSPNQKTIGEGSSSGDHGSGAQKWISNTDTRHSTDPHQDPGKSSKGEGTAETAKIKGTVQVDRKQV